MKSFTFSEEQITLILGALVADELARRHARYTESLVQAQWKRETKLGSGGLNLNPEERQGCAKRALEFIGHDDEALPTDEDTTLGDWSAKLSQMAQRELKSFTFYPHTQTGEAATRHSSDSIFQDGAAVASLLAGRRRCISMVTPHSLLGLVSAIIAPNLQRIPVLDGRNRTPEELSELLTFGDLVVATPTLWRYLASTLPEIPGNVVALSFGEALTMDLAQNLRQRGLGALRELYGSTETGVVGWRDSQSEPFTLFDHWDHDGDAIVRQCPDGRSQPLIPMDEVSWDGKRSFRLGARRDGAVQIGAINVFPKQIGEIIAEHPGIIDCEVRLSRRSGALDRLIADITAAPGLEPDEDMAWAIDEWVRTRLRPAERPRIYRFKSG